MLVFGQRCCSNL